MPAEASESRLESAVASGNLKEALEALRDELASSITSSDKGSEVAALAKQLADVLKSLASMPVEGERSKVDELSKRRTARRKSTPASERPAKDVKRRSGGD